MDNAAGTTQRAWRPAYAALSSLRYRLDQTLPDLEENEKAMRNGASGATPPPRPDPAQFLASLAPQIADARAAFALIRKRATEWRVTRNARYGGFGGRHADAGDHHEWRGCQSPPSSATSMALMPTVRPADAPPLFIAPAADDFFANAGYGLIDSWKAAKRPVEFHL